jgi:hypothetical protein
MVLVHGNNPTGGGQNKASWLWEQRRGCFLVPANE